MRCLVPGLLSFCFLAQTYAQAPESYLHNRTMLERVAVQSGSTNVVIGLPPSPPGIVGDVYLNHDYRTAGFILYDNDKIVTGYAARLDLRRNEFDLITAQGIRALSGGLVKSLQWEDSLTKKSQYFVNAKQFKDSEEVPYLGFFQVMSEGELILLKKTDLFFKEADQSLAHNVGTGDNKYIKKPKLYYASGSHALRLPGNKSLIKLLDGKQKEINRFIKINELDLNREHHVQALFDYYNSLVRK